MYLCTELPCNILSKRKPSLLNNSLLFSTFKSTSAHDDPIQRDLTKDLSSPSSGDTMGDSAVHPSLLKLDLLPEVQCRIELPASGSTNPDT